MAAPGWIDLLDPDEQALRKHSPVELVPSDVWQALRPPGDARPRIVPREDYVFAVLLVAVAVPDEDRIYYQEIDFVVTERGLLTIRKTPPDGKPFDPEPTRATCRPGEPVGLHAAHLIDDVAEAYLRLVDDLEDEVDELEDAMDADADAQVDIGRRIADLRRDMLRIRRTLAPTREAVRRLVDGRTDERVKGDVVPREAGLLLADVYDKLLRAAESLDVARELVAGARDYHQAQIANAQNEVMKRLTVTASLLLVPTFIVGLYGQNFRHVPELAWGFGYWWSWGWILVTTIAQLVFFRWKRWI
jgi:magnesium transporter